MLTVYMIQQYTKVSSLFSSGEESRAWKRCMYFCISVVKFIFELSSQLPHTVKFLSLMLLAEV